MATVDGAEVSELGICLVDPAGEVSCARPPGLESLTKGRKRSEPWLVCCEMHFTLAPRLVYEVFQLWYEIPGTRCTR